MSQQLLNSGDLLINRYLIESFVAEGGMQQVYKAKDLAFDRIVAVKVPKSNSAEKRFFRSAQVSAKITHSNVAKTLDYFEEGKRPFLVEEFLEGLDFGKALDAQFFYLDPHLAAHFVHLFSKGVAAAHHADVIHRDLKPSNIMVTSDLNMASVKITDFGIAKMAEAEIKEAVDGGEETMTGSTTAVGTLPYMAPEMIDKEKRSGKPADVWAIGAILYKALSGNPPFGIGFGAVLKISSGVLPVQPAFLTSNPQFRELGGSLWSIITACLQQEPASRPTADDLVDMSSKLCYSDATRFIATVQNPRVRPSFGFIKDETGENFFFHHDNCYGDIPQSDEHVLIAAYTGNPRKRAFPVLKVRSPHI